MAKSQWFVDPLYARMSDDLHLTGKSENTRKAYLRQIRKLSEFAQMPPDRITEDQLRSYFLHLSSLQTTMIYLHLTETAEADARKVIDKLFRRTRK